MLSSVFGIPRRLTNDQRIQRRTRFLLQETLETRCLFAALPSVTALRLSSDTIRYGESLTLIAEVAPAPGSSGATMPINSGSVVFREGTKELGRAEVVSGVARLVTDSLDAGAHTHFVAAYTGDGVNYLASESIDGIITTIAGNGTRSFFGDGQSGIAALLDAPSDTALDSNGNLYIADTQNNRIRKVNLATGVITTILELEGLSVALGKLAVDASDNLVIASAPKIMTPMMIARLDTRTGVLTQVAGGGLLTGDNVPALSADVGLVRGLAVARNGDIYFSDEATHRVRKLGATTQLISTVAGTGTAGYNGDSSTGVAVNLNGPSGVTLDDAGNLYFCDARNYRIRKVELATGTLTTIAGNGVYGYPIAASLATQSPIGGTFGIVYSRGSLLIAQGLGIVSRIELASGRIYPFAGSDRKAPLGENIPATEASFAFPYGIAADAAGNVFVADIVDDLVRRIDYQSGWVRTVAGGGSVGDFGPASAAVIGSPSGLAFSPDGKKLIISAEKHRVVRQLDLTTQIITPLAGNRGLGNAGDGELASNAEFRDPYSVAFDADGNLVITDRYSRIRKVSKATGRIEALIGSANQGYNGDELPGTQTLLNSPYDIAFDRLGRLFIADAANHRIRMFDPVTGRVTTIAGNGTRGFSGDDGPAAQAQINLPTSLAFDQRGDLYVADSENNRIRRIDMQTHVISTVAGNGVRRFDISSGRLLSSSLPGVGELGFDALGRLYARTSNFLVEIDLAADNVRWLAGGGFSDFNGDNIPLKDANIGWATSFIFDKDNNLYFAEPGQNRVKKVSFVGVQVLPALLHVTPVDAQSIYGNALANFSYVVSGFARYETLSTSDVRGQAALTSNTGVNSPVGSYTIVTTAGTLASRNYTFQFHTGVHKITPARLAIRAADQVNIYGDAIPRLTVTYEGFINGDSPASLDALPEVATSATRTSPVSQTPYPIQVYGASSKNYDIAYLAGALRVLPAPLLITANNFTKVYGDDVPTLTYSFTGFKNGETQSTSDLSGTLEANTSASKVSSVGTYAIDFVSSDVHSNNYIIQYKTASLEVTPASLTIIAEDIRKRYCEQMPALVLTYGGFVLGEGPGQLDRLPTVLAPVNANSPVGTYEIQIFGASDDNYTLTYQPGRVQVAAQPTSLILSASSLESTSSRTIDLSADVFPLDACQPIGLGQVEFYDEATLLGVAVVQDGKALLPNVNLSAGNHSLTAKYVDTNQQYEGSQSTNVIIHSWDPVDANRDNFVTALDALLIINWLNQKPAEIDPRDIAFDVNDDQFITAIDALLVINRLNQG